MKWVILSVVLLFFWIVGLAVLKMGSLADDYTEKYFKEAQDDELKIR